MYNSFMVSNIVSHITRLQYQQLERLRYEDHYDLEIQAYPRQQNESLTKMDTNCWKYQYKLRFGNNLAYRYFCFNNLLFCGIFTCFQICIMRLFIFQYKLRKDTILISFDNAVNYLIMCVTRTQTNRMVQTLIK